MDVGRRRGNLDKGYAGVPGREPAHLCAVPVRQCGQVGVETKEFEGCRALGGMGLGLIEELGSRFGAAGREGRCGQRLESVHDDPGERHTFDKLYVGMTGDSGGDVRVVALDEDLNATGPLETFVDISPDPVWIDGVGTDICGNVYVAHFSTSQLFRVTPDGQASVFVDWSIDPSQYGHGLIFGNGIGGFREDALYLPMPYANNSVQEVIVGVPSRAWAGTAINARTP